MTRSCFRMLDAGIVWFEVNGLKLPSLDTCLDSAVKKSHGLRSGEFTSLADVPSAGRRQRL